MREPYLHSTEDGLIVRNQSAILLKSSNYRCLRVNRVNQDPLFPHNFTPTLPLVLLCAFITGYKPRIQFAISFTAEQIFRAQFQPAQTEAWVQQPQIEIQPTIGAIVE